MSTDHADRYRGIDFREHPEKYPIGRGEQGVLIAEPYKSELLPLWEFKTPEKAQSSAEAIFAKFEEYKRNGEFVGMDMARKYLQMGYTRARRYANHPSGRKYTKEGEVRPQAADAMSSSKAQAAHIFYQYYAKAKEDEDYKRMKENHKQKDETNSY